MQADCECGYSLLVNNTDTFTFTELLESDFIHLANITLDTDWQREVYNVSAAASRGSYGETSQLRNIIENPLVNNYSFSGEAELGGDAGLQLWVRGGVPADGLVPVAEIDSQRMDMIWGSYRAAFKLTSVPGTCSAFFWVCGNSCCL